MKTMTKIIGCIDNFYGLDKATNELKNFGLFENHVNPDILIDQLTNEIWDKTYKQLLVDWCKIEQNTDQEYISKLEENGIKFTEEEIIWITQNSEGKIIWLELGQHNYLNPDKGSGLEHIHQKHTILQLDKWGYKTPKQQAEFLLSVISDPNPIFGVDDKGWIVYQVDTDIGVKYLGLQIGDNGYIVTARPYDPDDAKNLI